MAKVTFLHDKKSIEVPIGTRLMHAVEMAKATLPFGCRQGSCGTCRCLVIEGMENTNPPTAAEQDLFETLTSVHPNERLGCQLVVNGDVRIQS